MIDGRSKWKQLTALCGLACSAVTVNAAVVAANNPTGDNFVNATATPSTYQALGTSGWYYNNVRTGSTIGVNGTYPNAVGGSVYMNGTSGASKGDIEYLGANVILKPNSSPNEVGSVISTTNMGRFSDFTGMSYDWYRDSATTLPGGDHLHPSLRILLDADGDVATTADRFALIFEQIYQTPAVGTAATNAWQSSSIGASTRLWTSGAFGFEGDLDGDGNAYEALSEWQSYAQVQNAVIVGFSSGFGSGWSGNFVGAVDNISWTINGVTTNSNFEVQADVPEPGSIALSALALGALALSRRSRARQQKPAV